MVQENSLKKVIVICGSTASGKTSLAIEVAKKLNTEVISADSLIIYKGLNIGTAKPTQAEMQGVKHHLIDVCEPTSEFSVSDYSDIAIPIIDELHSKGKIPVICGGTGFYINSLLFDLSYGQVAGSAEIRQKYEDLAKEKGVDFVHDILKEIDPISASEIHANNLKRVIRAIEIFEVSGKRKSDIQDGLNKKYDYSAFAIDYPRDILYDRIDKRVDIMFDAGLVEEVDDLLKGGVLRASQSMQGIGYKEFFDYFDGKITKEELIGLNKLNTRHYAKRQITFFKRLDGLNLIPHDLENKVDFVLKKSNII